MNRDRVLTVLRKSTKWFLLVAIVAFVVYRVKFAAAPVQIHLVEPALVTGEVLGTGTLEARIKTTISPRIQERLAEVLADQGDTASAGQLLARLDDGELRRQVEVAEATLASAKATAERVRVDEARAEAVDQQARQEHKRIAELVTTSISSQAELDKAVEQLRVAEADWSRARAASVEAAQQVITAERNIDFHRERLRFAQILSPYDGLVTRRDRDAGGVVVPGSSILQLIATNDVWVSAWVDETAAAALKLGQSARVLFRSEPDKNYPGEVARLGRETDRETREFLVDIRLRELPSNWTIGQRAEVFIETGRNANALTVPQRFLHWREGRPGVFVAEAGKAVWRDVTPGLRGREAVEVALGLSAGEKVVVPANPKSPPLKPGRRVTAK